jgi:Pyridoxamine 5'-phosphate oxidase
LASILLGPFYARMRVMESYVERPPWPALAGWCGPSGSSAPVRRPDGSPHTVPLWIGAHGDRIVFLTGPGSRKARNLRRDPRMALSIAPVDNPFEPVTIRGRVAE